MMLNSEKIIDIAYRSKEEKWPYPQTFDALKGAGVATYDVHVSPLETIFRGIDCAWSLSFREEKHDVDINGTFDQQKVLDALRTHQTGQSSYKEFIEHIAHAGVVSYVVDMTKRTVKYQNADGSQFHEEKVPTL